MKRHNVCKRHVAIDTALVSNKLNVLYHFSPRYVNGIKMVNAFKYIFDETLPKLSVEFWKPQDS